MGACKIGGRFEAYDWKSGIIYVQERDEEHYGSDGYSGASNSCDFRYKGDKSDLTKKQLDRFINERMEVLDKRYGEVVLVGVKEYHLYKTRIEETTEHSASALRYLFKTFPNRLQKVPALLIEEDWCNHFEVIKGGYLTDMKKTAHNKLREMNYSNSIYILTKQKVYKCFGVVQSVKRTSKQSTDTVLVLPVYEFVYYGWGAE